jgi:hypothetical protein
LGPPIFRIRTQAIPVVIAITRVVTIIDVHAESMVAMADQEVPDLDLVVEDPRPQAPAASHVRAGTSMISSTRMASGSHLKVILLGIE